MSDISVPLLLGHYYRSSSNNNKIVFIQS